MRGGYCDRYHNPLYGENGVPTVAGLRFAIEGLRRIVTDPKWRADALELIQEYEQRIKASEAYYAGQPEADRG